jgi:hypothetical protein
MHNPNSRYNTIKIEISVVTIILINFYHSLIRI